MLTFSALYKDIQIFDYEYLNIYEFTILKFGFPPGTELDNITT